MRHLWRCRTGRSKGAFHLSVVGRHNVSNTLACLALASLYGIDDGTVQKALTTFHGADRRFEYKGEKNGFTIIDDYAHHPTEIRATLTAAKNYPHKTLWCAFQPHTYTRTRAFLKDFASALSLADKVILADIYAAREKTREIFLLLTLQENWKNSERKFTIYAVLTKSKNLF